MIDKKVTATEHMFTREIPERQEKSIEDYITIERKIDTK